MFDWFDSLISLSNPGSHWFWLGVAVLLLGVLLLAVIGLAIHLRLGNNQKSAHWKRVENKRQPQLLDYISGDISAATIHQDLSSGDKRVFTQLLARFATQVQGHERAMLEELAVPLLDSLASGTKSKKSGTRARCVNLLGTLGLPKYREEIVGAIKDPQLPVRMAAVQALILNPRCQEVDTVLDHLNLFEEVTDNYMSSLLASAGIESQPYMRIFMAMPDPPAQLRAIAARALLLMKDYEAADMVAEIISCEMPSSLLIPCLDILAEMGNCTHAPAIRNLLPLDDTPVFSAACRALGQVGDENDFPVLISGMNHSSPWVNLAAAQALGNLDAVDELLDFVDKDSLRAELAREVLSTIKIENAEEPAHAVDEPMEGLIG